MSDITDIRELDLPISEEEALDINSSLKVMLGWKSIEEWVPRDGFESSVLPNILNPVDTVLFLLSHPDMSISRLADGEMCLASGIGVPNSGYQNSSSSIKEALAEVLTCSKPKCKIALPKVFFYRQLPNLSPNIDGFADSCFIPQSREGDYFKYIKNEYKYGDACFGVIKQHYPMINARMANAYYSLFKLLFKDKDVILVTGDNRCLEYDKNLLKDSNIKSFSMLKVPSYNAWDSYDAIKKSLLRLNSSGNKLICLSCGPTASVLAYDLSDCMRCLDLGHVFGDYNSAMGGREIGYFWS